MYNYYGMAPQVNYQPQTYSVPMDQLNQLKIQAPVQQNMNADEKIWVSNETAAEAYLVAPNGFVRLWDSQKPVFYEKQSDASGKQFPMIAYKYEKVNAIPEEETYIDRLKTIEERLSALEGKKKVKRSEHESNGNAESAEQI